MKADWKDDIFEGNRRYRMITNDDDTVSFVDVTEYTQEGDAFGAAELNEIANSLNNKTADKLTNARSLQTDLASDLPASFDGSADAAPGVSGVLPVAHGGTGASTLASGAALIGNGTGAVQTRAITNLTTKGTVGANANLITANSLVYHSQMRMNRTTNVHAADTAYTTYMARGIALVTAAPTSMVNGAVAFVYE